MARTIKASGTEAPQFGPTARLNLDRDPKKGRLAIRLGKAQAIKDQLEG